MPTVPGSRQNVVPFSQDRPGDAELMMALGEMRSRGLFASPQSFDERFRGSGFSLGQRLDPSLQADVENRAAMTPKELIAAENQTRRDRTGTYPEPSASNAKLSKIISPPSQMGRMAPATARLFGPERESIGVSGGSR